jgi:diguanylate cyclase (GGDEF)-like protein
MALEAAEVTARGYRRPWYWLVLIALAASLGTWLIAREAANRITQHEEQFAASQLARLQKMEQGIDDYFVDAIQLVAAGGIMLDPKSTDRTGAANILTALYKSRQRFGHDVYAVGVFYAPYQFDPKDRLYELYVHKAALPGEPRSPFDRPLGENIAGIVVGSNHVAPGDDYTHLCASGHPNATKLLGASQPPLRCVDWYAKALKAPGATVFAGPYDEDGRSFISTLKAFYRSGKPVGVMAADTLTNSFLATMRSNLIEGDVASIQSSSRSGDTLLRTAPLPGDSKANVQQQLLLRYTGATLHLSSDGAPLLAEKREIVTTGVVLGAVLWTLAAILGTLIVLGWRSREANIALELQSARLENELAIGKKVEGVLRKAAYTDTLTALPNRAVFLERATEAIAQVATGNNRYAVFFIDLDRFNMVNDTLGHFAGDELLKMIAARLRSELPPEALVARLGGDEFLVLAETTASDAGVFADQILASLYEPMLLGGRAVHTNASIGVVLLDPSYERPEEVLRDADIAMYQAKLRGRGCYAIFDAAMRSKVSADSDLDNDLRRAIERHEFLPYYQPIVSIATRAVISLEALVRWNRPGRGLVSAGDFIEFAESRGLVDAIDSSMLEDVCDDAAALFEHFPDATVAVNISAGHLTAPGLAGTVERALLSRNVAPERVKLEITETAIMTNAALARATLDQLRDDGMQIVLDDFGAGHSSLAYLHRLPIAGLKIDRSFIEPLATDPQAVAIVRSIVALAHTLSLYTVAEGVETLEQLDVLGDLGVAYAQGFFFSPALSLADLFRFSVQSNVS